MYNYIESNHKKGYKDYLKIISIHKIIKRIFAKQIKM